MQIAKPKNEIEELVEAAAHYRQLDALARAKFLAWCEWLVTADRDPEADPRKTDRFWADYPEAVAVKV